MKQVPMTITIPEDLKHDLHRYIGHGRISDYIVRLVREELKVKKLTLDRQYKLVAEEEDLESEFKEWEDSMIGDGLNEMNDW